MRRSLAFLFSASLLMSGLASAAPPQDAGKLRPTLEQMEELKGVYGMSNGARVRVVEVDGRLYADIGKYERHELFIYGSNAVASRNGRVILRAQVSGQELTLAPRSMAPRYLLSSL